MKNEERDALRKRICRAIDDGTIVTLAISARVDDCAIHRFAAGDDSRLSNIELLAIRDALDLNEAPPSVAIESNTDPYNSTGSRAAPWLLSRRQAG